MANITEAMSPLLDGIEKVADILAKRAFIANENPEFKIALGRVSQGYSTALSGVPRHLPSPGRKRLHLLRQGRQSFFLFKALPHSKKSGRGNHQK